MGQKLFSKLLLPEAKYKRNLIAAYLLSRVGASEFGCVDIILTEGYEIHEITASTFLLTFCLEEFNFLR